LTIWSFFALFYASHFFIFFAPKILAWVRIPTWNSFVLKDLKIVDFILDDLMAFFSCSRLNKKLLEHQPILHWNKLTSFTFFQLAFEFLFEGTNKLSCCFFRINFEWKIRISFENISILSKYSQTCVQRPKLWHQNCNRCGQVGVVHRSFMQQKSNTGLQNGVPFMQGVRYSEVSVSSCLTVLRYCSKIYVTV